MPRFRALSLASVLTLVTCSSASSPANPFLGEPVDPGDIGSFPPVTRIHISCATPAENWVWCDDFDQDRLDRYFEYDDADGSFVREPGVGLKGSWGMRATFEQGQRDAGSLKLAMGATPQPYMRPVDDGLHRYREVYWRFYLRLEEGWTGGGGDKLTRATSFVSPDVWAQSMIAHVWSGSDPWQMYLIADPASGTDPLSGLVLTVRYNDFDNLRWLGSTRGSTAVFDSRRSGSWMCVEAHARLNDPGSSNGLFELWVDGQKEIRQGGLNWVGGYEGFGINAVFLENYWNRGSPVTQSRYFDDFVVSTDRIGCNAGTL